MPQPNSRQARTRCEQGHLCPWIRARQKWLQPRAFGFFSRYFGTCTSTSPSGSVPIVSHSAPIFACLYLYSLLWALFGYTRVAVTGSQLTTESVLFGLTYGHKKFKNDSIKALRYEEWSGGRSGRQNGVRFSYFGSLVTIARNADKQDSTDLINRLCEAYKFNTPPPKSTPLSN